MARRLYRSKRECIIGGVAGGLAEYFDIDPTIIRILWVLLALADGIGVIAYIIAWIIIPADPHAEPSERFEKTEGIREEVIDRAKEVEARLKGETPQVGSRAAGREGTPSDDVTRRADSGAKLVGVILVCIGALFLARNFWPWFNLGALWPIALVIAGILLLIGGVGGRT
ncbi:MAG: PspC domain-containing protein [Bacillota bacterium]|nr:PspC domain-containing protein [Bacillota bacterium]